MPYCAPPPLEHLIHSNTSVLTRLQRYLAKMGENEQMAPDGDTDTRLAEFKFTDTSVALPAGMPVADLAAIPSIEHMSMPSSNCSACLPEKIALSKTSFVGAAESQAASGSQPGRSSDMHYRRSAMVDSGVVLGASARTMNLSSIPSPCAAIMTPGDDSSSESTSHHPRLSLSVVARSSAQRPSADDPTRRLDLLRRPLQLTRLPCDLGECHSQFSTARAESEAEVQGVEVNALDGMLEHMDNLHFANSSTDSASSNQVTWCQEELPTVNSQFSKALASENMSSSHRELDTRCQIKHATSLFGAHKMLRCTSDLSSHTSCAAGTVVSGLVRQMCVEGTLAHTATTRHRKKVETPLRKSPSFACDKNNDKAIFPGVAAGFGLDMHGREMDDNDLEEYLKHLELTHEKAKSVFDANE